jgi:predicted outer membrane repeat protein
VTGSLASPEFHSVTIESCTASQRGGGLSALQSMLTMIDCTIQDNIAGTLSGGITIENQAVLIMSDSFVLNNESGGIGFLNADVSMIDSSTVRGNTAIEGGGLRISSSDVQVTGCVIRNNDATRGGGIQVGSGATNGAVLMLTSCTLMENSASTSGGGVYVTELFGSSTNETVTIDMCTFSNNSAGEASAALGNTATDSVTIQATTFCDHWYAEEIFGNWVEVGASNEFDQWCCGGDIDEDGDVDASDLQAFLPAFSVGFITENDREDVSRDGDADVEDLILMLGNWGNCS